jgi:hypothetical protein
VDAAAAVDAKSTRPPLLGNHRAVSTNAHTDSISHAIAAKISCAVAGSVGAVSCFIDSALK